jgi:hypothetical protein
VHVQNHAVKLIDIGMNEVIMYSIVYYKKAVKDIEKLKEIKLSGKVKIFIELIKSNPFQVTHRMKNFKVTYRTHIWENKSSTSTCLSNI